MLAVGSCEGEISIWTVSNTKSGLFQNLTGHTDVILNFDEAPKVFASSSLDKTVRIWSKSSGNVLKIVDKHQGLVTGVKFSPNSQLFATIGHDHCIYFWKVPEDIDPEIFQNDSKIPSSILLHAHKSESKIFNCNWNSRGDIIGVSGAHGNIFIIDLIGSKHIKLS